MRKKRVLSVLMVMVMAISMLVGCGKSAGGSEAGDKKESKKDVFKVAFLPTDMSLTFASWLASELQTAFEGYDDMELTVIDSKNQLETQLSSMETCVSQGYDYIILLPIEPAAEDDIVQGYVEDGTPVMMINLDDFGVEEASSVIANPYDLGTVVATHAMTLLEEDANVVVLLGPSGNTDSIERRKAYEDIMFQKYPNVTILDEQLGDWEKSKGMDLMESWIQVHGDKIDAVVSMNDAMAIGAYEAAKDAGLADKMMFFGVDGLADAAVSIEDDELTATALQDAKVMAEEGARVCHEVLTGKNEKGFEKVQIPVTLITKENVEEFITRYKENGMLTE
ncbi:ABC-type sugar transport system substrate-binding protein [Aequitasia blattaphilus]|uniref:Sugar ABC transporter substrate-binding protein n=1 Tax=Aequitasia blattaphilus TaxID=2949332 RepID=A0ABT1E5H7_9FIRM|nr:sugar ABC transporter substrate-binding protein [Aequitasia blattaphilus]MCP1100961.1 sugar ABC transporter substrate-binding protein [Aequitasia blattaphilus]MCR8613601.1 sugar ABC transporter substrate-binding protein [Aequitasia blattaphilus]